MEDVRWRKIVSAQSASLYHPREDAEQSMAKKPTHARAGITAFWILPDQSSQGRFAGVSQFCAGICQRKESQSPGTLSCSAISLLTLHPGVACCTVVSWLWLADPVDRLSKLCL